VSHTYHPGRVDPEVLAGLRKWLGPLSDRMWPSTLHGLENLPSHGRYIVIANHSGGGAAELLALLFAWLERFGDTRPVCGMAHPAVFRVPFMKPILRGLGAVEATREGAAIARAAEVPLLLFPGGDHEAMRPFWEHAKVDFNGRKGWVRLAREHGLAVVPLAITGSHLTNPMLVRSRAIAWLSGLRVIGVRRAPLSVLSLGAILGALRLTRGRSFLTRALAADLAFASTMLMPWLPGEIDFHLLPSIDHERITSSSDEVIYDEVTRALGHVVACQT
jgi:1-acyl-sn-glycerol-3-phosphate acyltransferase